MLKKNKMFGIISISMAVLLMFTGCSSLKKHDEIVIGVAWPFKINNNLFNEGIDLAVKEINSQGGVRGRKVRLLKEDDGSQVQSGMAIAQSFVENKEVQAVIGHQSSFVSIPASTIYENAGIVMLSPASTAPDLMKNGYKYIFRSIPSDEEIAKQLAIYLKEQGYHRMAVYYSDDSYGTGLANSFEDNAKLQGIEVVDRFNYYTSMEDLRRLNERWRAFGVDGIFIAGSLAKGGQFISDAGKAGITLPFIAGNALDSSELSKVGGSAAEGTIVGSVFNPYDERTEVKSFVYNFEKEYSKMPSSYAAQGYDAVKMLAAAIEKSDLDDPSTVSKALMSLGKWSGVSGIHEIDQSGNDVGELVVLKKMHNGTFEYIKK